MNFKQIIQFAGGVIVVVSLMFLFMALPECKWLRSPIQPGTFVAEEAGEGGEPIMWSSTVIVLSIVITLVLPIIGYCLLRWCPFIAGIAYVLLIGLVFFMVCLFFPSVPAPVLMDGPVSMDGNSYVPDIAGWRLQQTRYGLFWITLLCVIAAYSLRGYSSRYQEGD